MQRAFRPEEVALAFQEAQGRVRQLIREQLGDGGLKNGIFIATDDECRRVDRSEPLRLWRW